MSNRSYRYRDQWPIIAERINRFQIRPNRVAEFEAMAHYHIKHKDRYIEIERDTNVPWPMIATIHRRENIGFDKYLGNGQPLSIKTTIVPKNRGPFHDHDGHSAFYWGALDALAIDGLDKVVPPWPIEKIIFHLEPFNGLGYFNGPTDVNGKKWPPMPSPYIWGGSNIQESGKYVSDHNFRKDVMDTQPGCACILWMLGHLDVSIHYTRET